MKLQAKRNLSSISKMFAAAIFLTFSSLTVGGCQGQVAEETLSENLAEATEVAMVNAVIDLDDSNFSKIIENGVVLVDFWAAWCAPCRTQLPIIEDLAKEIGDKAVITKLDVDKNRPIAQQFNIRSIPTLLLFKDGKVVKTFRGVTQKATLMAAINEIL